ncbi:methionine--tRNA ligase [Candidatus Woesearchaeota archaeon]|nr:methionine--tRNA ligase [Candidatus Woesearchaeota archaeon]
MAKKKIVVTSALPYANGSIHIGHLVEYIQTDIFVRFLKLTGEDAIYCCADDTHGTPIQLKSEQLKITPEKLIAKYSKEHQEDFKAFHIKFDSYYTTNSPENQKYAEFIFKKLKDNGDIYTKEITQTYCEQCQRFLPDRYVKGECPKCGAPDQYGDVCESCGTAHSTTELINPRCAICGAPASKKSSNHYFFRLSSYSKKLDKWLTGNKMLQPEIVNYIRNWIKEGLQDWDISRDGPYFGFKIPGEENKYFYVWLDAPVGYISSTANYCRDKKFKEDAYWKKPAGEIIHVIGKDIIYFHYLFWPAMLMGSGFNLPKYIVTHGFLTVNGEKMSKSRGTFFTAREFLEKFDPQLLRYYYASMLSKKMVDIDLDFKDFQDKANNELVANIANFCFRVLSFTNKNFGSKIGEIDENKRLFAEILEKAEKAKKCYADFNFNQAVKEILAISSAGNKYFQEKEPWKMVKENEEEAKKVLGTCINIVKVLSIVASPVLPFFAEKIQSQLNLPDLEWDDINFETKNHEISKAEMVIRKLESVEIQKDIFPLDLKVARITAAGPHPEADKLVVLQIDLGKEKRQIVAGIKKYYKPEELVGKNIIVVSNLKPAKLRGIESNGMLLAALKGEKLVLLGAPNSSPGDQVSAEGAETNKAQITIDDFAKVKLGVRDKKVLYNEKALKTEKEEVTAEIEDGAKVS